MPDDALRRRFEAVVQGVDEPLVRQYLQEAFRCFVAEAYNGALVMAWNAVSCHVRLVIETVGVTLFRHNYRVLQGQEPPAELWQINDNLLIQTCHRAGILRDVTDCLDRLRSRRNQCAHPTGVFVSLEETMELVETIAHVVSRHITDERLTDPAVLREFARIGNQRDTETIAPWVHEDLCPQLAHDLLTFFERDDEVEDLSGIIALWRGLWNRLDELTRQRLWTRVERIVQTTLHDTDTALRSPEALVTLIVWPNPDDEHPFRDRVGHLFVEWFEELAQSGRFSAADMELACGLRQRLPRSLSERLRVVLQEMTRRYTE